MTNNPDMARHCLRAAGCQPTHSAGTGLPAYQFWPIVYHLHNTEKTNANPIKQLRQGY